MGQTGLMSMLFRHRCDGAILFGERRRPPATIAAEIDRIIGLNIRRTREDVRLGQHEMAGLLNVSTHVLARYEDGQERTPAAVLLELTRHLGCQLTDLFAGMPSLEAEEEFQGSRPSTLPAGPHQDMLAAPPGDPAQRTDCTDHPAAQPATEAPQGSHHAPSLADAATVTRIIEAYAALDNPNVRERLLQLLLALQ